MRTAGLVLAGIILTGCGSSKPTVTIRAGLPVSTTAASPDPASTTTVTVAPRVPSTTVALRTTTTTGRAASHLPVPAAHIPTTSTTVPATPIATHPGWQIISYHGVTLEIPPSWVVSDGEHAQLCHGPFGDVPKAFLGPHTGGSGSCPAVGPQSAPPPADGLWMQPGTPPEGAHTVTTPSGQSVSVEGTDDPPARFSLHHVSVWVSTGPDPSVAKEIFESVGYTANLADTRPADACQRNPDAVAMPTPERLGERFVVEQGTTTLDPPDQTDTPAVTASSVWGKGLSQGESLERYRLVLARFSAKFPAHLNPDGSTTPIYDHELAWVIYAEPYGSVPGCGMWGFSLIDAHTGIRQLSASYAPGP